MRYSVNGMDKLSMCMFFDDEVLSIDELIENAKSNHFSSVLIDRIDGMDLSEVSIDKVQEVKYKLENAGLTTFVLASQIGNISLSDDFDVHLEKLKSTLKVANILRIDNIRIFSFIMPSNTEIDKFQDEVFSKLLKIIEICLLSGVYPLIENSVGTYADNCGRCLKLFRKFPTLKGIFNFFEFLSANENVINTWYYLKDYTKYLSFGSATEINLNNFTEKEIQEVKNVFEENLTSYGKKIIVNSHLFLDDC